jgi:hypothetical protein
VLRDCPLYPPVSLICHHDDFIAVAAVLVLRPRRLSVGEVDPELRMFGGYILQLLCRVSELQCSIFYGLVIYTTGWMIRGAYLLEDEVFVHPVVGLLVEAVAREWVSDIENVAIDLLVGLCGHILGQFMVGR